MLSLSAVAGAASAAEMAQYSIPPQSLDKALEAFGAQSGHPLLVDMSLVKSKKTQGLQIAATDPETALKKLLAGTGLSYTRDGEIFAIVVAKTDAPVRRAATPATAAETVSGSAVEGVVVTAQKKRENIQDVPIAISAFSENALQAQKVEGGFDLLKAIPNVTFSKSNFSGYNFSIRGIGTKAVSASTDPGVAVAFNNTTLIVNRLFEQEYFDIERVEVLRGPQGTLYGRNATSGVINVITEKPQIGLFEGDLKVEYGNYNAGRVRGMVNIPIGDTFALRFAAAATQRDGYGENLAASDPAVLNPVRKDVDGRDLWSARLTLGWEPIEQVRVNLMWERFEEDDNRVRTSKQLCHHDPGPQTIGAFDWASHPDDLFTRATTSQGCLPGSLYDEGAFGTPNGASLPYISSINFAAGLGGIGRSTLNTGSGLGYNPYFYDPDAPPAPCAAAAFAIIIAPINVCQPDPYGGLTQSRDLRSIYSTLEPTYRAKADIFELSVNLDLTDSLSFTSQTVYSKDEYYASQDYNRFSTVPVFGDSAFACGETPILDKYGNVQSYQPDCSPEKRGTYKNGYYNLTPGGVFTDPQLGPSSSLLAQDLSEVTSDQFNQEFRLATSFDLPVNFSLGANFTRFETHNDYYVFINALSLFTYFFPFNTNDIPCDWDYVAENGLTYQSGEQAIHSNSCVYVDPNPLASIDGEGHNYFRSANPYELTSSALFGELYWQVTDTIKVTVGARMTWDRKVFTPIPSQLLLRDYRWYVPEGAPTEDCTLGSEFCPLAGTGVGGRGSVPLPDIVQEWREPTGRVIVDWKPELSFTDETMVYGSISHGYKGGGANPPNIAPPAGFYNAQNSGVVSPPTFEPEFINAYEVGTKNTLMEGALVLNGAAFFYEYEGYQVSKIVDRSASNENFDATVWGAEFEWIFSPTRNLRFNGSLGYLHTEIADGERSIDLMDRTQGGTHSTYLDADGVEHALTYTEWAVHKPFVTSSSNCVVPVAVLEAKIINGYANNADNQFFAGLCPGGGVGTSSFPVVVSLPGGGTYTPSLEAPNGGAGFFAELGGNELPNAPHWTMSLGAQYTMELPGLWEATGRVDHYWQDESFARVYNTEYDRLRSWTNTNLSFWVENPEIQLIVEAYVKNVFDETPITDSFLNSDDSGLTTNVFTLDPRVIGVSVRKSF